MPTFLKAQITHQAVEPGNAEQQNRTSGQSIDNVIPPCPQRLWRAPVHHQRVGGKREHFVEQEKGEQVTSQRNTHGAGYTQTEKAEEPAPVWRIFQVTDGINGCEQP